MLTVQHSEAQNAQAQLLLHSCCASVLVKPNPSDPITLNSCSSTGHLGEEDVYSHRKATMPTARLDETRLQAGREHSL